MPVLVIGDSSINVFLQIPNSAENVTVDDADRFINFRMGSKTQLEREVVTFGGNALNVAVGLARQGIMVDLYSIIGNDMDGERIVEFLLKENESIASLLHDFIAKKNDNSSSFLLNVANVKQQNVKTNVGYVVNFKSERFLLIDTSTKNYNLQFTNYTLQSSDWVFLSSIGPNYESFFADLIQLKKEKGFKLAYNPSSNELKNPVETYIEMLKASDILFVNKKEAGKILTNTNQPASPAKRGEYYQIVSNTNKNNTDPINSPNNSSNLSSNSIRINPDPEMQSLLQGLQNLNHGIVVITDGIRGSYAHDGEQSYFESSSQTPAKEKTGAGDAFESGFLSEYIISKDAQKAMKKGTQNAASVIKFVGAIEGLLYK